MIIRQEEPSEYPKIYDLVKAAFQTAKVATGSEQDYVDKLRVSGNYIPQLAFVAEEDSRLVGHIMLTKTYVITAEGSKFDALLLAPLSIALEYRNRGIGQKLVWKSFELAKKMGFRAVFVVCNPAYYSRFGFKSSVAFGIKHVPVIPDPYVMIVELTPNALARATGTVTFA